MFRERRQWNTSRRSQSGNLTPERRQSTSSPIRQYNDNRSISRPPTPDRYKSRPPTPDRKKSILDSNSKFRTSEKMLSTSQSEYLKLNSGAISARSKSLSPTKLRDQGIDSFDSNETLTARVAKQMSKGMKKTIELEKIIAESNMPEQSNEKSGQVQERNDQVLQRNTEINQDTASVDQQDTTFQMTPIPKRSSLSYSPGNIEQMEDLIQAQNEQINFFEECVKRRSSDIEQLTLELELSKKNESKLYLELEIHDLKYSMYDDFRRTMDRLRLDNAYDKEESSEMGKDLEGSLRLECNNAFSKLEHLGHLYEKSKLESESRFSILQEEYNNVFSTRFSSHPNSPEKTHNMKPFGKDNTSAHLALKSDILENRIKILQSENLKYSRELKRKEEELKKAKLLQPRFFSRIEENILKAHNIEKQTLKNKISALETEIGFASGNIDNKVRTRRYRALEKNLNDYVAEIMGLEDQLKIKDKVIGKLKERDLILHTGLEKRLDHLSVSSAKWHEPSNKKETRKDMSTKPFSGMRTQMDLFQVPKESQEKIDAFVGANNKEGTSRIEDSITVNKTIEGNKIGSKTTINRNISSRSSSRIAMLRKRLDALANDYSSVGTEDTQISIKTSP